MPFGGGGALHVGALIREIGLKCALVPRFPASHRRSAACSPTCATTWCRHSISCSTASTDRRSTADARGRPGGERGGRRRGSRWSGPTSLRARHALSRADAHRFGAAAGAQQGCTRRDRRHDPPAFETAYLASFSRLLPGVPRGSLRCASPRSAAARPSTSGVRARPFSIARNGPAGIAPGVVRWRMARNRHLVATRPAGRTPRSAGRPSSSSPTRPR